MNSQNPRVLILVGSASDNPTMEACQQVLNDFGIPFEYKVASAHRAPEYVAELAKGARSRGVQVIIAAAGMAAHLPGVVAAMTTLPVIGVPLNGSLDGLDSLLSIAQMPGGIPVATVAIGKAGAKNAAVLAVEMMAMSDEALHEKLVAFREEQTQKCIAANN